MKYDYIIVGAGSAGCVLATRLTENKDVNVLLVEAGRKDHRADFRIHMPAALAFPLQGKTYNWYYESLPDPYMNNRKMYCPRGKVLGGSSSINGMCYIRGHAMDFERWADETGFAEWDYKHCLAYFKKSEQFSEGENDYHGVDGYLGVTRSKQSHPLFKAFIKAGVEAGYPETDDLNGFQQEGFGPMDRSTFRGRRHSTARAYLANAMARKNLTVLTHHHVHRVLFKDKQAVGIEVEATNSRGQKENIYADHEVILSAGAIGSPQLLLLSGIGHEKELNELGIECVAHLPGVGENLQDHLEVYVQYACKEPVSLYSATKWYNQLKIGAEWLFLRQGVGASNQFEAGGFIYSDKDIFNHPNLQYHFIPLAMNYDGSKMQGQHGYQAHVAPMRPESKGFVKLNSKDALAPPDILFNYMSTERDRKEMRDGVRLTREVLTQAAFSGFRGVELSPGLDIQSDEEIDNYVREHGESAMHPACTCKMGDLSKDNMSVVNNEGKVYGVEKLRVIDASIMPSIISGNLNATTIMMAEKMADKLRNKPHAEVKDIGWYERSQS